MNIENEPVTIEPYFLGPKSENEYWVREKIQSILDHWFQWRKSLFTDELLDEFQKEISIYYKNNCAL